MVIRLKGGTVFDPANGIDGEMRDIYIQKDQIIKPPDQNQAVDETIDITGRVVMPAGIDLHTHIGGGKVNIARMMLPENHAAGRVTQDQHPHWESGHIAPPAPIAGYRYAEMGYVACFEPAMLPTNARQTHMELADTPMIDKGAYALLGNDDFLLRALRQKRDPAFIRDYIGWILHASQALAIKVVNPGGISAFKFNQRQLDLDERNAVYGVTPRKILLALSTAVESLGLAHPLHIHGCNLGVPGNVNTTISTITALDGIRAHLTHLQFHSYGTEGDRNFSSGAAEIAEIVNRSPNISLDVGQIMFGRTVTESGDVMQQFKGSEFADPKKWVGMDIECDAGCGVVPFRYKSRSFVNALQWAIGLELFLLIDDPWRIFLTTDHPNGAPFTSYPHLIRLLMDRSFRRDMLSTIHADAAAASHLGSLAREYTLYEIATITRAAPARSLGLTEFGSLGIGDKAHITVYKDQPNREKMFAKPELVFKDGSIIVRKGRIVNEVWGATHVARPDYDRGVERELDRYFDRYMTLHKDNTRVTDDEIRDGGRGELVINEATTSR